MKKIGIFLDEIKDFSISEQEKFAKVAFNTGNLIFWESLKMNLNLDIKSRWYIKNSEQLDLSEYKAFVTTDLIWIRQMQDLSYLNDILDAIGDLPLAAISVGLQNDDFNQNFLIHPNTIKVLKRISERFPLGVRGEYTAEILNKYGINKTVIIGCPSMYMNTLGLRSVANTSKVVNAVAMNFQTFFKKLDKFEMDFLTYGMKRNWDFVEQTQNELSTVQINNDQIFRKVKSWLDQSRKCFFNVDEWRQYLRQKDFNIGGRFHGNVIGLWEGVPALFLTSDSRTKELCRLFSLPQLDISAFDGTKPVEYYYEMADYSIFHSKYSKLYINWNDYLFKLLKGV